MSDNFIHAPLVRPAPAASLTINTSLSGFLSGPVLTRTSFSIVFYTPQGQVMNKKRFLEDYSDSDTQESKRSFRPVDFGKMFAGNIDDCFRIGLSLKRNSVKLYSPFYSSDVIIASPLGLRTVIGTEGLV